MEGLSAESKAYIEAKIRSGEYPNEEAVLVAPIEALKRQEAREQMLRMEIESGFAEARAGQFTGRSASEIGEATKREILNK